MGHIVGFPLYAYHITGFLLYDYAYKGIPTICLMHITGIPLYDMHITGIPLYDVYTGTPYRGDLAPNALSTGGGSSVLKTARNGRRAAAHPFFSRRGLFPTHMGGI